LDGNSLEQSPSSHKRKAYFEKIEDKKYGKRKRGSSPDAGPRGNNILEVNIQESMGDYTKYSKKLYKNIDQFNAKRARSAKSVVIKGIQYRF
jgi:hypothetical protein